MIINRTLAIGLFGIFVIILTVCIGAAAIEDALAKKGKLSKLVELIIIIVSYIVGIGGIILFAMAIE